jgi:UDP-N-acetylmuramate dehydrogenase
MSAAPALPLAPLPPAHGRLVAEAPVGRHTWFGVGGPAEILFEPADAADLAAFLAALPSEIPVAVIGGGANMLIRDGGLPGVAIRLGRGFAGIAGEGRDIVAGAAALHLNIALFAAQSGISGVEFLSGIPGTIGGGLRMNAGAFGRAIADVAVSATAIDRAGSRHVVDAGALGFSYRHTSAPGDWVFVAARLRGEPGEPAAIARQMAEIRRTREATQPIRARTGGSTFRNPPGEVAWQLIDRAGCRGLQRGGAMVSPKHTNFLINTGSATAADLEGLGEEVRRRVYNNSGVALEWEICRIGRPSAEAEPVRYLDEVMA